MKYLEFMKHLLWATFLIPVVLDLSCEGQDVHNMTVYEWAEFILLCPGYKFPSEGMPPFLNLSWYKAEDDGLNRVAQVEYQDGIIVYGPVLEGTLAGREWGYNKFGMVNIAQSRASDEGIYTCDFTDYTKHQISLTVNVKANDIYISKPEGNIMENTIGTWNCTAQRIKPLPVSLVWTWYWEDEDLGGIVEEVDIGDGVYSVSNELQLNVTHEDNWSSLKCTLTPAPGHSDVVENSVTVRVAYAPKGNPSISLKHLLPGQEAHLTPNATAWFECYLTPWLGNPVTNNFKWFMDGELQTTTTDFRWRFTVNLSSTGNYSCVAENEIGESGMSNLVALHVTEDVHNMTVYELDPLVLECPGYEFPSNNLPPNYTLNWYQAVHYFGIYMAAHVEYQDGNITSGPSWYGSSWRNGRYTENGSIEITYSELSDDGVYTCDFTDYSIQQIKVSVNVKVSDLSVMQIPEGDIKENTIVTWYCTAWRIKPLPQSLVWTMDGIDDVLGGNVEEFDVGDGVYRVTNGLQLNVTYENHRKRLTCTLTPAPGQGGVVENSVTLHVKEEYPPSGSPPIAAGTGYTALIILISVIILVWKC